MTKKPDAFTKGEILRADRINEIIDYAAGGHAASTAGMTGFTSSRLGTGLSPIDPWKFMLVQAAEDFDFAVTDRGVLDDVPSGMVRMVRLNMQDSVHETSVLEDRAYDVLTGLQGGQAPAQGEYFYVLFNRDSGRWEKIGGSLSLTLVHGIPRQCLNDGWYLVELGTFNEEPRQASDFEDLGEECSLCDIHDEGTTDSCLSVEEVDRGFTKPTPIGVFVFAHDADGMPLKIGGHVKMVARGAGILSASGSISYSASDNVQNILYDILSGTRKMIKFPAKEVWTCCDDGTVVLTSCTSAIVYGIACDPATDTCP